MNQGWRMPQSQLPFCHVCSGQLIDVEAFPVAGQVTSDCRPWPRNGRLSVCQDCGVVQKPISEDWLREIQEIYAGYVVYEQGGGVEQASFDQNTGASTARSQRIVEWLQSHTELPKTGSLLDIGCGNGAFLRAFGSSHLGWQMEGLELDSRNKNLIESIPGVRKLNVGSIDGLETRFDLIVLIHALEHIPYPVNFLKSLAALLNPGGRLLIEVPDLQASPFDILISDHCTHFSASTLRRTVVQAGFNPCILDSTCVAKELTLLADCSVYLEEANGHITALDDRHTANLNVQWLRRVLDQGGETLGPLGVFGTSISGTWLAEALGDKVEFFVDEDLNRTGRSHLGRLIYSPKNAPKDRAILLPLRIDIAIAIAMRLAPYKLKLTIPPPA